MKRAIIGGFSTLTGAAGVMAVFFYIANNMANSWSTPPGRFLTSVSEQGMMPLLVLFSLLLVLGILGMAVEYFRKDDK